VRAAAGEAGARVVIRMPGPGDAPRLDGLVAQLGYPSRPDAILARLERILASPDDFLRLAEVGADVVGWVHAAEEELFESGRRCEIRGLVVDVAARRSGVGGALVAAVETWASERGLPEVSVRSNIVRAESHPFYERLGYARTKTQHVYRKTLR
jgi:GNAT superfamily N-acetyltransferase